MKSDREFEISFIIVNYNYLKDIKLLISSMASSITENPYEIIVIDNASTDGSKAYFTALSQKQDNLTYLYLEQNRGYGAANNIGVKASNGNVVVLINPDTLVKERGFDTFILNALNENTGIVSPRIVYPDGKVQPNCGTYATPLTYILQSFRVGYFIRKFNLTSKLEAFINYFPALQKSFIGTYLENFSNDEIQKKCDWVSGACLILKKEVFLKVGGFDENFFLYCEDEDLCRRVSMSDYNIIIDRQATIIHNEGFLKSRKSRRLTLANEERYKSNIYYLEKYSGHFSAITLRLFYFFQHLINALYYSLFDPEAAKTYYRFLPVIFKRSQNDL